MGSKRKPGTLYTITSMKTGRLRECFFVAAFSAASMLFTGCGGDDDDAPAAGDSAAAVHAPESLNGTSYMLLPSGGGHATLAFDAGANTYRYMPNAGIVETGSFAAQRNGAVWNVQMTRAETTSSMHLALTFTR